MNPPSPRRRRLLWSALLVLLAALAGAIWLLVETMAWPLWLAGAFVSLILLAIYGMATDALRGVRALWKDRRQ